MPAAYYFTGMYISPANLITDTEEIIAFMKQYSFASIIIIKDGYPTATHLPFLVSTRNDQVILTAHLALANPQWKAIETQRNLIIFTGPHAYISPRHYDSPLSVPTWNYVAVHAYGQGRLITDEAEALAVLEKTILAYEPDYRQQWEQMPMDYKVNMQKGIVAFEITVNELEAKKKLSQNKNPDEQQRIINSLLAGQTDQEKQLARFMQQNLDKEQASES